jgi:LPXTG-motif cell wall-anchored protein
VPTTTVPATIVPTPPDAVTDPVTANPGQTIKVFAPCKKDKKVKGVLKDQSRIADCVALSGPSLTQGIRSVSLAQAITYDGLATFTLTAPAIPGSYDIEIELEGTGISYVIPFTVIGNELPATGSDTTRTGAALAIALLGVGALATSITRRRRHI